MNSFVFILSKSGKKKRFIGETLNISEIKELMEVVKDSKLELPIFMAAFYGLRRGEIVGLRWDNINFNERTLIIKNSILTFGKERIYEKNNPKTKKSHRTLYINDQLLDLLQKIKQNSEKNKLFFGNTYNTKYEKYLCLKENGDIINPNYITKELPKILKKNNIKKIRFHDLRHSCATLLYNNGCDLKMIQNWLGHSSISTTMDIYTHMPSDGLKSVSVSLNNIFKNNNEGVEENKNEIKKI